MQKFSFDRFSALTGLTFGKIATLCYQNKIVNFFILPSFIWFFGSNVFSRILYFYIDRILYKSYNFVSIRHTNFIHSTYQLKTHQIVHKIVLKLYVKIAQIVRFISEIMVINQFYVITSGVATGGYRYPSPYGPNNLWFARKKAWYSPF